MSAARRVGAVTVDAAAAPAVSGHRFDVGHVHRSVALCVWVAASALMVATGCSTPPAVSVGPDSSPPSLPPASAGASDSRGGELHALSALGIIGSIAKAGFAAPDPRDATARDCADIGCDQSIVTDTVSVMSFPTTGRAELYAAPRGLYQVGTVVVSFASTVPESEQSRYRTEIQKLVG